MTRQRLSPARLLAPLALLLAGALRPAAVAAQSVQVFVNSAWVHTAEPLVCGVAGTPPRFICPLGAGSPVDGVISNEPHIEFEENGILRCNVDSTAPLFDPGPILGTNGRNFCNHQVFLCAQIGIQNNTAGQVAIDEVNFELFKYADGSNALDPASTPPLRTFFIDAPGSAGTGISDTLPTATDGYCVLWDGSINIQGELGKSNGQYGFRVTVKTNQQGQSGNIVITQTRAYPSGATRDTLGNSVSQKPIIVDVTNVHVVRSSPTVVGSITGVAAQPYNLTYRLSKDATMFITIDNAIAPFAELRRILPGLPRVGEGTPNGTLLNGDSWDGRDENGNILPPGVYLVDFQAIALDQYSRIDANDLVFGDLSFATTRQIAIDPLQITDIRVQPLLGGATNLAVLSYLLTESATVYVDIYAPGTQFCQNLNSVNSTGADQVPPGPPKNFDPKIGNCAGAASPVLRRIVEQKQLRTPVISFWDGRDESGNFVADGDYVFVIYAALPSQRGYPLNGNAGDMRIWTSQARVGFISVLRGLVGITQVSPTSSVIGSSPAVAGLNPFTFRYQLSRDAVVNMKVFDETGAVLIKTLVQNETRPGNFANSETWVDGTDDSGRVVSSGTYLIQLTATDPVFPAKVSTVTASFPVNMFRIVDVAVVPLLSGATENVILNYQLSQPMFVAWNIYPPGAVVVASTATWPPCPGQSPPNSCTSSSVVTPAGAPVPPVVSFRGLRPGRLKISEFWDGRDANGLFVPDGNYVFTLTAESTTTPRYFATDRVHGIVTVARGSIIFTTFNVNPDSPALINSSNTITLHPFTINYALTRQSSVTVQILNTNIPPQVVRNIVSGAVRQGALLNTDVWDGRDDRGNFPPAGFYLVRAVANDVASVLSSGSTAQLTISYDPLRIYDLAIAPLRADTGGALLSYQVSEPMKISIKIYAPGTVFDSSGNPSPPEAVSLVRRIVGVRPARTEIQDLWDGRDFKLSLVKDGVYKFKIVGSTDLAAIDDVTGNVINPGALSLDRLIDEIPVVRNASVSPREDFETNTFAYPNPVTGASATFNIYAPFKAKASLRLFTISGELVLDKNFGEVAPSFQSGPTTYVWGKSNQGGRTVGRGLYFAVIRLDETEGGRSVLQTVKKVLVP